MNSAFAYFPHPVVRAGQSELLTDIKDTFSQQKILLAQAPTGLGKTASALSIAVETAIKNDKKVFFLTNRHTQHRIAIDTLQLINKKTDKKVTCVDLIGKRWMCSQEIAGLFGNEFNEFCKVIVQKGECEFYNKVRDKKGTTVEAKRVVETIERKGALHNEDIISLAREERMCAYELSLEAAKKATVIIGDYYYLFNPFVQNTLFTKLGIDLEDVIVIVDEGHNLPTRATEMLSHSLSSIMIKNAILEAKKYGYGGVISWLQDLMKVLSELAEFSDKEKEKLVRKEEFTKKVKEFVDYDELIHQLELAADEIRKKQRKSFLGGISVFLEAWVGEDEGFARVIVEKMGRQESVIQLQYLCLDPAIVVKDIFAKVHAGIVMSGTLQPTFMYKDVLGITKAVEREYHSPFPPENKLSIIVPETSTKYTLRGEEMYKLIAQRCSSIVKHIPGNVALFFPSYDLRDRIGYYLETIKMKFWEKSEMTKEEKEQFLMNFKDAREQGGILLGVAGANFAEGVDFPGDLLQGVVIVGLPLRKPDLKTREIINYYEKKFGQGWNYGYTYPAISKCIQSAGRCIRSETDRGAIIYLDERFVWKQYYDFLPREGLIVSKEYEKLLKEFFGNGL